jgi:hypothetical protein
MRGCVVNAKEIKGYKTCYVDCDQTLVMDNLSEYKPEEIFEIQYTNGPVRVVANRKNINLLTLFYKLGYTIIIWSKTGSDWATLVGEALGVDDMVSAYLSKPLFYIDDKDASEWIGERRYREY